MSIYIQTKLVNGGAVLFLELDTGEIYFESAPLYSCKEILDEAERITRDIVDAAL